MSDWKVKPDLLGESVFLDRGTGDHICKDGKIHNFMNDEVPADLYYWKTKQEAEEFLAKWLELDEIEIKNHSYLGWYIQNKVGQCLWRDNQFHGGTLTNIHHIETRFYEGRWETREEAEKFLTNYLKGTKMENLQEKLEQAKLDRDSINKNIEELKNQLEFKDYYRTGVYTNDGRKYFLGFSASPFTQRRLQLYCDTGNWQIHPFEVKAGTKHKDGVVFRELRNQADKDYMSTYTYVGGL